MCCYVFSLQQNMSILPLLNLWLLSTDHTYYCIVLHCEVLFATQMMYSGALTIFKKKTVPGTLVRIIMNILKLTIS